MISVMSGPSTTIPHHQQSSSELLEKNKRLVRNFIEDTLNSHDIATIDKYFSQDPETEGFKEYRRRFWEQFPDSHTTIDHIIAEDDKVLVMLTTTGTNKQTGNRVTIKSADLYRIENGMIAYHWDVVDRSGMA
jgi:predicted SnoaL-like aldol condensation-catalyzing enzyme